MRATTTSPSRLQYGLPPSIGAQRPLAASSEPVLADPVSRTNEAIVDVLSGFDSTTDGRTSRELSLEDALSLDDDSEEGKPDERRVKIPQASEQLSLSVPRGFLLPRSPARIFVHSSFFQSALNVSAISSRSTSARTSPIPPVEMGDLEDPIFVMEHLEDGGEQVASAPAHAAVRSEPGAKWGNVDSGVSELVPIVRETSDDTAVEFYSDDDFLSPVIRSASSSGGYHTPSQPSFLTAYANTEGNLLIFRLAYTGEEATEISVF